MPISVPRACSMLAAPAAAASSLPACSSTRPAWARSSASRSGRVRARSRSSHACFSSFAATSSTATRTPSRPAPASSCRRRRAVVDPGRPCQNRPSTSPRLSSSSRSTWCSNASRTASVEKCTPVAARMLSTFAGATSVCLPPDRTWNIPSFLRSDAPNVLRISCTVGLSTELGAGRERVPGTLPGVLQNRPEVAVVAFQNDDRQFLAAAAADPGLAEVPQRHLQFP